MAKRYNSRPIDVFISDVSDHGDVKQQSARPEYPSPSGSTL